MGNFNIGTRELALLGAYTVYLLREWGLPVWLGMPFARVSVELF